MAAHGGRSRSAGLSRHDSRQETLALPETIARRRLVTSFGWLP